jgi:hypothetical protein
VEAVFVDLQNGRLWQLSSTVSRRYMGWEGDPKTDGRKVEKIRDEDQFLSQTCKGEAAKLVRNCILACISPIVKEDFEEACMSKRSALLDEEGTKKLLAAFKQYGVTQARIEKFLGRTKKMGWTADDAATLRGIYTGIRDGEMTVDEAFEAPTETPEQSTEPEAAADPLCAFKAKIAACSVAENISLNYRKFCAENPELANDAAAIAQQREQEIGGGK